MEQSGTTLLMAERRKELFPADSSPCAYVRGGGGRLSPRRVTACLIARLHMRRTNSMATDACVLSENRSTAAPLPAASIIAARKCSCRLPDCRPAGSSSYLLQVSGGDTSPRAFECMGASCTGVTEACYDGFSSLQGTKSLLCR